MSEPIKVRLNEVYTMTFSGATKDTPEILEAIANQLRNRHGTVRSIQTSFTPMGVDCVIHIEVTMSLSEEEVAS